MCIRDSTGAGKALLVHAGTAALEMAALLIDCRPGDEIIMPSYTFGSTAVSYTHLDVYKRQVVDRSKVKPGREETFDINATISEILRCV